MSKPYNSPTVKTLGTVQELTAQGLNKVGNGADQFTAQIPALVGSIVPAP
jgi:hypothetical protein